MQIELVIEKNISYRKGDREGSGMYKSIETKEEHSRTRDGQGVGGELGSDRPGFSVSSSSGI